MFRFLVLFALIYSSQAYEPCSNVGGELANSESCACGTSDCTPSTGLYCLSEYEYSLCFENPVI
jgi:hypothetical protein